MTMLELNKWQRSVLIDQGAGCRERGGRRDRVRSAPERSSVFLERGGVGFGRLAAVLRRRDLVGEKGAPMIGYYILTGGIALFAVTIALLDFLGERQRRRREEKH
jgi:hypothetical protein